MPKILKLFIAFSLVSGIGLYIFYTPQKTNNPSLESVKAALAKEGNIVSDDEARQIMYDKQLPLPLPLPSSEGSTHAIKADNNIQSEVFRILKVDEQYRIQLLPTSKPVYLKRIEVLDNEILQLTVSDSFKEIAKDDLQLMKFTNEFMNIKDNPTKGLKIQMESISLSEYLKELRKKNQNAHREDDLKKRGEPTEP